MLKFLLRSIAIYIWQELLPTTLDMGNNRRAPATSSSTYLSRIVYRTSTNHERLQPRNDQASRAVHEANGHIKSQVRPFAMSSRSARGSRRFQLINDRHALIKRRVPSAASAAFLPLDTHAACRKLTTGYQSGLVINMYQQCSTTIYSNLPVYLSAIQHIVKRCKSNLRALRSGLGEILQKIPHFYGTSREFTEEIVHQNLHNERLQVRCSRDA